MANDVLFSHKPLLAHLHVNPTASTQSVTSKVHILITRHKERPTSTILKENCGQLRSSKLTTAKLYCWNLITTCEALHIQFTQLHYYWKTTQNRHVQMHLPFSHAQQEHNYGITSKTEQQPLFADNHYLRFLLKRLASNKSVQIHTFCSDGTSSSFPVASVSWVSTRCMLLKRSYCRMYKISQSYFNKNCKLNISV